MTQHIRRIEDSEYETASEVILLTFRDCVASSMEPQGIKIFDEFAAAEAIRSHDAIGSSTYLALDGAHLVGVLHVRDDDHISLLFVLPALHGKGIGRALIDIADQSNRLLTVNSSINATHSYESYGFSASGPEQVTDGIRFVPMQRNAA